MNQKTRRMLRGAKSEEKPFNPFSESRKTTSVNISEIKALLEKYKEEALWL